jgi:hypothetical protein
MAAVFNDDWSVIVTRSNLIRAGYFKPSIIVSTVEYMDLLQDSGAIKSYVSVTRTDTEYLSHYIRLVFALLCLPSLLA